MRTIIRSLGWYWKRTAALSAATLGIAGAVVLGAENGVPAQTPRLLSGSAWLPSPKVGQITLLDGSSTEVAAQLQVASPGNNIDVVQHGSTAYAIDRSSGTIRRVDGATYTMTPPEAPIPNAPNGLSAFTADSTLYAVDTKRGILAVVDSKTLARQGEPISLAAELAPGSAAVDRDGRLWLVDNATGSLTRLAGRERITTAGVTSPGRNVLTTADGQPVIINTGTRKAIVVDPDNGEAVGTFDLGLRPDDTVTVTGSANNKRVYLVASRGALIICEVAKRDCGDVVPLNQGSSLGAPVEAGNRVFVPDYTAGQVWVIDLSNRSVLARPQVLNPRTQFQLLNRDGVVFYNDLDSERAGVIQLNGSFTPVLKFDPSNPGKGLTTPVNAPVNTPTQPQTPAPVEQPVTNAPPPPTEPTQQPGNPAVVPPVPPAPPPPPPPPSPPSPPPPPPTPPAPDTPKPPTLKITLSKTTPMAGEDVTLQVGTTTGEVPRTANWDFGDGQRHSAITVTHQWAAARTYQVSVQVVMPNNTEATTSVSVTVSEIPKVKLTVTAPTGGKVNGPGIACPPTCVASVTKGQSITLIAQANPGYTFGGWGGACTGTGNCTVAMNADKTVSATFKSGIDPFVGNWSTNASNPWVNRAQITAKTATTVTVRLIAPCSPPCDWGPTTGTLVGNEIRAFYDQGFATRTVRITVSNGQLVVRIHHDYIPPDTRTDTDSTDVMQKN